jgi:hypothetical protein
MNPVIEIEISSLKRDIFQFRNAWRAVAFSVPLHRCLVKFIVFLMSSWLQKDVQTDCIDTRLGLIIVL